MEKIRIGIIARRTIEEENRPLKDKFIFVNNFSKRIAESGGIPYGVLFPDGKFNEDYLDIYDGFLFHSGAQIDSHQLATLHYAIKHNKPVLGICLGEQVLGAYSYVIDKLEQQNIEVTYESIISYFDSIKLNEELYLTKIEGHDPETNFYITSIDKSKHDIYLEEDSKLFKIYGQRIISQPSLHNWVVKNPGNHFKVAGYSSEGYIEALEYDSHQHFIVGVQFHPELEQRNNILFKELIKEAKKRK